MADRGAQGLRGTGVHQTVGEDPLSNREGRRRCVGREPAPAPEQRRHARHRASIVSARGNLAAVNISAGSASVTLYGRGQAAAYSGTVPQTRTTFKWRGAPTALHFRDELSRASHTGTQHGDMSREGKMRPRQLYSTLADAARHRINAVVIVGNVAQIHQPSSKPTAECSPSISSHKLRTQITQHTPQACKSSHTHQGITSRPLWTCSAHALQITIARQTRNTFCIPTRRWRTHMSASSTRASRLRPPRGCSRGRFRPGAMLHQLVKCWPDRDVVAARSVAPNEDHPAVQSFG